MSNSYTEKKRIRKNFGSKRCILPEPDLLSIQIGSFKSFVDPSQKEVEGSGLDEVFRSVFPITAVNGYAEIEYISFELSEPKFGVEECKLRGASYAATLTVRLRLLLFDKSGSTLKEKRKVRHIIEEDVYLSNLPLMTDTGTFIINGTERVVVAQLHRSPGVIFEHDRGKTHSSEKVLFSSRVIPYRGSWLDFEFDHNELLHFRVDCRRKLPVTTLLRAMGFDNERMFETFFDKVSVKLKEQTCTVKMPVELLTGAIAEFDIKVGGKVIVEQGRRVTARHAKQMTKTKVVSLEAPKFYLEGKVIAHAIVDKNGEVLASINDEITEELLSQIEAEGVRSLEILYINESQGGAYISDTLRSDTVNSREEARMAIYHVMRPGEPATEEASNALFENLFFTPGRYDLSKVGRMKLNRRLGVDSTVGKNVLSEDDILGVIKLLIDIKNGNDTVDDVDTLANRRVRAIGEMVENQFRLGLVRVEKLVKESLNLAETDELTPTDLINSRPITVALKEFFGSSKLSQFMDQVNPLSGITHKRRISALGPGGLTRERAGFEVRDVHPSHYGRLCPIETPEGPNIGLINTLAVYSRTNEHGFLETPYQVVHNGKVTDEVVYVSAIDEPSHTIAQANAITNDKMELVESLVSCRRQNEFVLVDPSEVTLIDVDSKQTTSVAASLIPFLEHDDANRALMGSNMQRQAVPTLRAEKPLVGTGIEYTVAKDSRVCVIAKREGFIEMVDADRIVVRVDEQADGGGEFGVDIYNLIKYARSNQNTCINQKPLVRVGDRINEGDILADGPATDMGELALGQNVLIAFMPWNGYNFEDSILISERVVEDDCYTSVHIEELTAYARDTKLGPEEITADVPNVSESTLTKLDEVGVVYVGARVKAGDILVGKITPKSETVLSPEEKLLRAIFGEKASNVKDTSLKLEAFKSGVVIDVRIFARDQVEKDERIKSIDKARLNKIRKDVDDEFGIISKNIEEKVCQILEGQKLDKALDDIPAGAVLGLDILRKLSTSELEKLRVVDAGVNKKVKGLVKSIFQRRAEYDAFFEKECSKINEAAELPAGVIKMVKVYVATLKPLQVGDKMAGRHGNKGVISRVSPVEDMPYMADGTPIDVVLNPLGVPSRMSIGQVLEVHLGWAAHTLGKQIGELLEGETRQRVKKIRSFLDKIYNTAGRKEDLGALSNDEILELSSNLIRGVPMATPVFDGIKEDQIKKLLKLSGLPESGQVQLYDGRTGEPFDRPVTVGHMYMLKLNHLVDDKMHARSTGPYSLVTQQPLSGKAQFGGQRLGEMEVWALEAYGAAHALQEMLTVKSDDVLGRAKTYKDIVDGTNLSESVMPESFNVLIKEIKSLAINIETI